MTNVQMVDTLDAVMDKLSFLSAVFTGDVDTNSCQDGIHQFIECIYQDVSDVYDSLDARREEEAKAIAERNATWKASKAD